MTLTQRGRTVVTFVALVAFLSVWGIAGYVDGKIQDTSCDSLHTKIIANPNDLDAIQLAWNNNCPFQDENGEYLYTWTP